MTKKLRLTDRQTDRHRLPRDRHRLPRWHFSVSFIEKKQSAVNEVN